MLEAGEHEESCFVTLTYDDKHNDGNLHPEHIRDFLKRFRKEIEPRRIRYFAVGEYGDETDRPHYHMAIFGYPTCQRGRTRHDLRKLGGVCCDVCEQIRSKWNFGAIDSGSLTEHSAQYIAGYVTKKMTAKDDPRLQGRHPEFARMSNRPGLGLMAMHDVADAFLSFNLEQSQADVPAALRLGSRMMPVGRYLKGKLREMTGMDTQEVKDYGVKKAKEEVQGLRENQKTTEKLSETYQRTHGQRIKSFEAKQEIFKKKGHI